MFIPRKRRAFEITPAVRMATRAREAWERHWGSPERALEAWRALGPQLVRGAPFPPEIWWVYTANIPAELREARPAPDPRWCLVEGAVAPPGYYDAVRAWRGQQAARLGWRVASGQLSEAEVEAAGRHIVGLRRAIAELPIEP